MLVSNFRRTPASYGRSIRQEKRAGRMQMTEHEQDLLMRNALALQQAKTSGALEERKLVESGLGSRQESGQDFARPLQTAEIGRLGATTGKLGAETATITGTEEREKGFLPFKMSTLSRQEKADIKAEEIFSKRGEMELNELEDALARRAERIKREKERKELQSSQVEQAEPATPAERQLRSGIKSLVWEGTPTKTGLNLPGLLAPVYGYKNIMDWYDELKSNVTKKYKGKAKEAYEYAFPRR